MRKSEVAQFFRKQHRKKVLELEDNELVEYDTSTSNEQKSIDVDTILDKCKVGVGHGEIGEGETHRHRGINYYPCYN